MQVDEADPPMRAYRNAALIIAGQIVSAAGVLVGTKLLTEVVSPAEFGLASLALGLAAFGLNIYCAPMMQAVLRHFLDFSGRIGESAFRRMVFDLIFRPTLLVSAAVLAGGIAAHIMFDHDLILYVLVVVMLAVDIARYFETNILHAAHRQTRFTWWNTLEAVLRPAFAVAAAITLGPTAVNVAAAYIVASVVLYAGFREKQRAETDIAWGAEMNDPRPAMRATLLRYARPLIPLALVIWISSIGDRYIIGALLNTTDLGIYVAAYGLASRAFQMLGSVITLTLRPHLYAAIGAGNARRESRLLKMWWLAAVSCGLALLLFIHVFNEELTRLLLGSKYAAAATLLPLIALGYFFSLLSQTAEIVSYAHSATDLVLRNQAIGSVACIAIVIPAVHGYGILGAAAAVPLYFGIQLAFTVLTNLSLYKSRRIESAHP